MSLGYCPFVSPGNYILNMQLSPQEESFFVSGELSRFDRKTALCAQEVWACLTVVYIENSSCVAVRIVPKYMLSDMFAYIKMLFIDLHFCRRRIGVVSPRLSILKLCRRGIIILESLCQGTAFCHQGFGLFTRE